jgi:nucleoid-associated protein YgaU/DNA-binding SARP family transcriptional activator
MTTTPTRTHRRDALRALGAAVVLVLFVVGAPIALVALAPVYLPDTIPTLRELGHALTSPDDGTILFAFLAAIGWIAWAAFTLSVVLEIVAGLRRVSAPSIPLLGSAQWAASRLVASTGVFLALSWTVAHPAPASAASLSASRVVTPVAVDLPTATPRHAAPQTQPVLQHTAPAPALPSVVVQRGDTLWDIAERHLGNGARFTEIQNLNLGRPQSDGSTLSDSHWIYPGWTLLLPADATTAGTIPSAPEPVSDEATAQVIVQPGDTLWNLAAEHLGDGERYVEIYADNAGRPQPDGTTLTDPSLIEPGWTLDLPPAAPDAAAVPQAPPTPAVAAAPAPAEPTPKVQADVASPLIAVEPATDTAGPRRDSPESADTETVDAPPEDSSPAPLFIGLTALAAAGVIGELARRRHLQHRARRVGESIPMPDPESPAAAAERTLRTAATPVPLTQLRVALQNIDSRCYAAERDLPRIAAITLDEHTLTLHLLEGESEPVPPFIVAEGSRWVASTEAIAAEELVDDHGRSEPYPTLVPLGHTDDATVLLNLEAAGTLSILGDHDATEDVLRALAVELVTSDLTGRIALVTDPSLAELADAFGPARLYSTPDDTRARTARAAAIADALEDSGLTDTLEARSDRTLEDTWLPVIYLEHAPVAQAVCAPWSGSVLIATAASSGWTLTVTSDGAATLEPLGINIRVQRLSETDLTDVTSLLRTAQPPVVDSITSGHQIKNDRVTSSGTEAIAQSMREAPALRDATLSSSPSRVRVDVLGPIEIYGLTNSDSTPPPRAVELLTYLALHREATGPELDEVFWPGKRDVSGTRNTFIYRTRRLVGDDALPTVKRGGRVRVTDEVGTDWAIFRNLTARALDNDANRCRYLSEALALVRGRPFLGIDDAHYAWAENDIQQMIGAIADVAHLLARTHHGAGRYLEALEVATRGLQVEPFSALLQSDALSAAAARGDDVEYGHLRRRFDVALAEIDPDA